MTTGMGMSGTAGIMFASAPGRHHVFAGGDVRCFHIVNHLSVKHVQAMACVHRLHTKEQTAAETARRPECKSETKTGHDHLLVLPHLRIAE